MKPMCISAGGRAYLALFNMAHYVVYLCEASVDWCVVSTKAAGSFCFHDSIQLMDVQHVA
eukprot:2631978-Pleurochrysis_carterae.AAC.1